LPASKLFKGIGVASLHVTLTNSAEDVHLLFKSSPFGSQSHGHNAQNSFQLNAYGEQLLVSSVYRDWHGSPFHYEWAHSTLSQNAVLVDGENQLMHSPASRGVISGFSTSPEFDMVSGSAVEAYGGRLIRAQRTIAFVKPDLLVMLDDLEATNDVSFQFMFHALGEFKLSDSEQRANLLRPGGKAVIHFLGQEPMRFRQWDGFEPKPEREFPNQWHLQVSTPRKSKSVQLLTVIIPEKPGTAIAWSAKRMDSDSAIGARVRMGERTVTLGFRKAEQGGEAVVGDLRFGTAVGWKRD
jgi:hypothetical protein